MQKLEIKKLLFDQSVTSWYGQGIFIFRVDNEKWQISNVTKFGQIEWNGQNTITLYIGEQYHTLNVGVTELIYNGQPFSGTGEQAFALIVLLRLPSVLVSRFDRSLI